MKIRCFLALPLPADVQREIADLQRKLISSDSGVKWESPDKFHITMKFLGGMEESSVDSLTSSLSASVQDIQSFTLSFRDTGSFPTSEQPRVIWIGTDVPSSLVTLHRRIEDVCATFGVKKDDRPFHPHVTLGRVKSPRNIHRLTEVLKNITFEPLPFRCSEIRTMRSELLPTGSHYTLLSAIPLHL